MDLLRFHVPQAKEKRNKRNTCGTFEAPAGIEPASKVFALEEHQDIRQNPAPSRGLAMAPGPLGGNARLDGFIYQ